MAGLVPWAFSPRTGSVGTHVFVAELGLHQNVDAWVKPGQGVYGGSVRGKRPEESPHNFEEFLSAFQAREGEADDGGRWESPTSPRPSPPPGAGEGVASDQVASALVTRGESGVQRLPSCFRGMTIQNDRKPVLAAAEHR